jgi:hypothetical protein
MKAYKIKVDIFLFVAVTVIALNSYLGMLQNETIGNVIRGGTWLLIFAKYAWCKYTTHEKPSKFIMALLIYAMLYLVKYIGFSSRSTTSELTGLFSNICFCILFDIYLKNNLNRFLSTVIVVYSVVIVLNFIIVPNTENYSAVGISEISEYMTAAIRTGTGRETYIFVGHRNNLFPVLLSKWLICVYLYCREQKIKYFLLCLIIAFFNVTLAWSATSLVGVGLISIYTLLRNRIKTVPIISLSLLVVSFNFAIIFYRIQYIFSYFIENILHKSLTFTGRVYIWDTYIEAWGKSAGSFLFGIKDMTNLYIPIIRGAYNPHNIILYILSTTGIIGCALTIVIFALSLEKIKRSKHSSAGKMISIMILVFLVMGITAIAFGNLLPMLYIGYGIALVTADENKVYKNNYAATLC